ncbi:MAG: SRPBCC domain-containing protein [Saprospiraceae bacterium]|nr:SRPBCC domain-containing protein [Saprospiraceae bacterium]
MSKTNKPIFISQTFEASASAVWAAITEAPLMRQWFFENIKLFEPVVEFETEFTVHTPNRDFVHIWKVLEADPMRKIKYDWRYGGYTGHSTVLFELIEHGNQTILHLTHEGTESFSAEVSEFSRENGIKGWKYFINEQLRDFLALTRE